MSSKSASWHSADDILHWVEQTYGPMAMQEMHHLTILLPSTTMRIESPETVYLTAEEKKQMIVRFNQWMVKQIATIFVTYDLSLDVDSEDLHGMLYSLHLFGSFENSAVPV